ncbi:MAG: hypothetical protein Q8R13_02575 [bacterium]|nr:hypothetical protein [bacterium]
MKRLIRRIIGICLVLFGVSVGLELLLVYPPGPRPVVELTAAPDVGPAPLTVRFAYRVRALRWWSKRLGCVVESFAYGDGTWEISNPSCLSYISPLSFTPVDDQFSGRIHTYAEPGDYTATYSIEELLRLETFSATTTVHVR